MMDAETSPPVEPTFGQKEPTFGQKLKRFMAPMFFALVLIGKFLGKIKLILLPALKFLPVILKTGGTMVLSIWFYAMTWGVWFAVGFVVLLLIHECGHLLAARQCGLKVGAPVFIPFMGAFISLKEAPRDAWVEAKVGIGGPLLGTVGAAACELIYLATGKPMFRALAYTGFFLNLFNLTPVGFLDGGRIATALSPWLWVVGFAIMAAMAFLHPHVLLIVILIASVPRLWSLFRDKSEAERRYFEITSQQRWTMAIVYFGLIAVLVAGMRFTLIPREAL
jgi:Zn-dependent protease